MADSGFAGTLPVREDSKAFFLAMSDPKYDENFSILSVTYDGWPTEAICLTAKSDDGEQTFFEPIAIFVNDEMKKRLLNPFGEELPPPEVPA